jgi:hypothetical protein
MFLVATEDALSEAVARRLVAEAIGTASEEIEAVRKGGYGYLKNRLPVFCTIGRRRPVFVLTDLDKATCAPRLIARWMSGLTHSPLLLFRVAVREIEAWLMADRPAMAEFLHISLAKIPRRPEAIQDPKQQLLTIARKAPRALRNDLLPARGTPTSQGLGYNARLCEFVQESWSPDRAAENSFEPE